MRQGSADPQILWSAGNLARTSPLMVMILAMQLGVHEWLMRRLRGGHEKQGQPADRSRGEGEEATHPRLPLSVASTTLSSSIRKRYELPMPIRS